MTSYYTETGGQISTVSSVDGVSDAAYFASSSSNSISYWYIALFRRDEAASPARCAHKWGVITEPSPQRCQTQLLAGQRFERKYEEWAQLPSGCATDTYFNPLGLTRR
jgi:hypothetical protein